MKPFAWLAVGAALLTSTAAVAQGGPHPVRGVVTAVTADSLTLTAADGKPVVLALTPTWIVSVMQPIAADAIQPGSFIGSAEMPQADGNGRSLEVHIFPPGVKMGEGHYAWDLQPDSSMTRSPISRRSTMVACKRSDKITVWPTSSFLPGLTRACQRSPPSGRSRKISILPVCPGLCPCRRAGMTRVLLKTRQSSSRR